MSTAELEITIANIEELIAINKAKLSSAQIEPDICFYLSGFYRTLGCAMMLARYDHHEFFSSLLKSAMIYHHLLKESKTNSKLDPYYLCKSKGFPFFDAIAVGAFDVANAISSDMKKEWMKKLEYEDDFIYYGIIQMLIQKDPNITKINQSLGNYQNAIEGIYSPRFHLMKALIGQKSDDFDIAFQDLIREWEGEANQKKKNDSLFKMTEAHIFIEGIALIRIAEKLNVAIHNTYHYIPDILLKSSAAKLPDNLSVFS